MCGRFALYSSLAEIKKYFRIETTAVDGQESCTVAPGDEVLAIINRGGLRLGRMRWGLVPSWARDARGAAKLINARCETLRQKNAFKNLLRQRRCAIPADGFYEWKKEGASKQAYFLQPASGGLCAFAGLWDTWADPAGPACHTCTIITTAASPQVSGVHDRMPVVLTPGVLARWLDPRQQDPAELESILQTGHETQFSCRPVGKDVYTQQNTEKS